MQKIINLLLFISTLASGLCFGQISVKTMDSLQHPLADSLVRRLAGFGVSVSQISTNLKATNKSLGSFRSQHPAFPFAKGIVMSTGFVDSVGRPNRNIPISSRIAYTDTLAHCSEGRWLLNQILKQQSNNGLLQKATDVATIRFNLVPEGDSLRFRYLFASEEYTQFVCSQFNDIFGFFIKGPGIEGDSMYNNTALSGFRNLARLPQNQYPVAINTVNNGHSGPSGSLNNCRFSPEGMALYRSNLSTNSGLYNQLAFDGLTHALEAKTAVYPCQSYTIILAISDVGDRIFDSGVFLEQGSMVSGKFEMEKSNGQPQMGDTLTACAPLKIRFRRCPNIADRWVIRFQTTGSAVANQDFQRLMPDGQLLPFCDSLVIAPGQSCDSLILQALGSSMENKTLSFHFQDMTQPWVNGQPHYSGVISNFIVRPRSRVLADAIEICAQSQAPLPLSQQNWPGYSPSWKEVVNGVAVASQALSCDQCPHPIMTGDNQNRTFVVRLSSNTNNCQFEDTLKVFAKEFYPPTVSLTNDSLLVQQLQTGYTLEWKINGSLTPVAQPEKIAFTPGFQYDLHITAPNGCDQWLHQVQLLSSTAEKSAFRTMQVFPNPAHTEINIVLPTTEKCELEWFNTQGKHIRRSQASPTTRHSVSDLAPGTYWLKASTQAGDIWMKRVVIGR